MQSHFNVVNLVLMCKSISRPPPATLNAVLRRIRQYALDRAIPMGQLAAEAGLGVNTLRDINSSKWNPTARTLSRLESLMACDADD